MPAGTTPVPVTNRNQIVLIRPFGTASSMFDKGKFVIEFNTPTEFSLAEPRPLTYRGFNFSPSYKNGILTRYETRIENLLLHIYPGRALIMNSLHKLWHGVNYTDFYKVEIEAAIAAISDSTGIDWLQATPKELEYGCNLETNASLIINSLLTYKHKDYFPMVSYGGKKYGAAVGFDDYGAKAYDKQFEVKSTDRISLRHHLFRWEIWAEHTYLTRLLRYPPLVKDLLTTEGMNTLAADAVNKFKNSIKVQQINLYKLTAHQKLVYAAMKDPQVRDEFKAHHKDAFKKYKKMIRIIMTDPDICVSDNTAEEMAEKFNHLINEIPVYSISGKRGMIVPSRIEEENREGSNQLIIKNSSMQTQELSTMSVSNEELIIPGIGKINLRSRTGGKKNKPQKRTKEQMRVANSRNRKKAILAAFREITA